MKKENMRLSQVEKHLQVHQISAVKKKQIKKKKAGGRVTSLTSNFISGFSIQTCYSGSLV